MNALTRLELLELEQPPPAVVQKLAPQDPLEVIKGYGHINLLDTGLLRRPRVLPWWLPLACVALVGSGAGASALFLQPRLDRVKAELTQTEARLQTQTERLEAAAAQASLGTMAQQLQALQAALTREERWLAMLGGAPAAAGAPATEAAFSSLLQGLSHTQMPGLWLTGVRLDRRQAEVRLEGRTHDAQAVSGYIDELGRNPAFRGLVLRSVEVARGNPASGSDAKPDEPARFVMMSSATAVAAPSAAASSQEAPR